MKKKLLMSLAGAMLAFSLVGCGSDQSVSVNVSNNENISSNQFGKFISIGNDLVYDSATRIIYIENVTYYGCFVYTPYYAPNGLPYRYNPETNTFEYSDVIVHTFRKFRAPFSGKAEHTFPEPSAGG